MKKLSVFFACVLLALSLTISAVAAEIHINEEKPADWNERDLLRITFFAAYKSDSYMVECGGMRMFVDGGATRWRDKTVASLTELGALDFDYLYSSHPHDDHIDNQYSMIYRDLITAKEFLTAFPLDYKGQDNARLKKMLKVLGERGIPYRQFLNGEELTMGGTTVRMMRWDNGDSVNSKSGTLRYTYGDATILIPADLSGRGQREYMAMFAAEDLKADIIKAPHHGIMLMVPEFIDVVDPKLVVFTSKASAIKKSAAQVENRGIRDIFNNDGRMVLETDGTVWYVTQEKGTF